MRRLVWVWMCAACAQEAPTFTPPQSHGALAQIVTIDAGSGYRTLPITPTQDGDRIFALLTGTDANVNDIVAGTTQVALLTTISEGACDHQWVWGWISSAVEAGVDSLVINSDGGAPYAGYALIFSGLSPDIDIRGETWTGGSDGDAITAEVSAAPGNVTVSSVATCGAVLPELSAPGFVGMPPVNGAAIAYEIAHGAEHPVATWALHDQKWRTYSLALY